MLCGTALTAVAQDKGPASIHGRVVDEKKQPVSFSTVGIFHLPDSTYVSGASTDEQGYFNFTVPFNKYFLRITMLGYTDLVYPLDVRKAKTELGSLVMKESAAALEEVLIKSERNQMDLKLDKRVFNVASNLNNAGANAAEVLENIPSVTVDAEGNVSLRGKQNVRILIDGKFSGLINTPDALQQLQASMIEKVEVITNASARYDAQGEVGIINIVLKKNKKAGWNGAVNANIGYNPQYGGGFNVNYRKGNLNLYANYAISQREQPGNSTTYQKYTGADTAFVYEQEYSHTRKKRSNNGMIGLDYDINNYNVLSATFMAKTGLGNNFYARKYNDLTLNNEVSGYSVRDEDQTEIEDFYEAAVSYKKTFAQKEKLWTVDVKWASDADLERSAYTENSTYSNETNLERSSVNTNEKNWLIQTDFVQPIFKEGKIEGGYRSALRHISNGFAFSEWNGSGYLFPSQFNDDYRYLENIHAGYFMAGNRFGRFSAQAGLRGEYSDITTQKASVKAENNKRYFNLFPSLALSYKLSESNNLQLSYSRRVNRPGQWDLLPFTKFGDNREMRLGNPDLNPEFTHAFEAGWLQTWDKGSLLTGLYYRNTSDVFQRLTTVNDDGLVLLMVRNLARQQSYGMEFNFNYEMLKWLKFNTGLNFFRELTNGNFQGRDLSSDNYTWTNRSTLNATLAGAWRTQASFNYTAPRNNTQGRQKSTYYMDLGISRELLKGNATLAFNVRDVFNTRRWRSITDTPEIYAVSSTQWRPRSAQLSLTYRFNQKPGQDKQAKNNFTEEG